MVRYMQLNFVIKRTHRLLTIIVTQLKKSLLSTVKRPLTSSNEDSSLRAFTPKNKKGNKPVN